MPKDGYRSITVTDEIYTIAEEDANSENRSVQNYIKHLVLQERHFKQKFQQMREDERLGTR